MGHIEVWGNVIPNLLVMAGRAIKEVSEHIPLKGFKLLDRVVFGLTTMKAEALTANLAESVLFGAVAQTSEGTGARAESVLFGAVVQTSEGTGARAESVVITNV